MIAHYFDSNHNGYEFVGCFEIGEQMHISDWFPLSEEMTPHKCYSECVSQIVKNHKSEMNAFVIRNGGYCGCADEYGKYGLIDESQCHVKCLGDLEQTQCAVGPMHTVRLRLSISVQ